MQRPAGVTVIAVLDFIGAGLCVLGALGGFLGGSLIAALISRTNPSMASSIAAGIGIVLGVIFLFFATIAAVTGFGMIKLQNWGRIIQLVLTILSILGSLRNVMVMGMHGPGFLFPGIFFCYDIWVVWYLFQPDVKAAFGQQA
jgi:hypothetical protein